jgi:hypothetical protein
MEQHTVAQQRALRQQVPLQQLPAMPHPTPSACVSKLQEPFTHVGLCWHCPGTQLVSRPQFEHVPLKQNFEPLQGAPLSASPGTHCPLTHVILRQGSAGMLQSVSIVQLPASPPVPLLTALLTVLLAALPEVLLAALLDALLAAPPAPPAPS